MGITNTQGRIPSQELVRQAAAKIFETESGLAIDKSSWHYRILSKKGVASAQFSLSNGTNTVFSNITMLVRCWSVNPCRLQVQASINGLTPMNREFYVVDDQFVKPNHSAGSQEHASRMMN